MPLISIQSTVAYASLWIQGPPGLHSETLTQNQNKLKTYQLGLEIRLQN